jgi:uncharacterized membrane protein
MCQPLVRKIAQSGVTQVCPAHFWDKMCRNFLSGKFVPGKQPADAGSGRDKA